MLTGGDDLVVAMDVEQVEREQNKTVEAVVKPLFEDLFVASEVLHQLPSNQEEAKTESILSPTYLQTSPNQLQILAGIGFVFKWFEGVCFCGWFFPAKICSWLGEVCKYVGDNIDSVLASS